LDLALLGDLSEVTVLTCYLLPESIITIRTMFDNALQNGTRVVCNTWGLPWLEPKEVVRAGNSQTKLFLYDSSCSLAPLQVPHYVASRPP
jgi:hypothetical protein